MDDDDTATIRRGELYEAISLNPHPHLSPLTDPPPPPPPPHPPHPSAWSGTDPYYERLGCERDWIGMMGAAIGLAAGMAIAIWGGLRMSWNGWAIAALAIALGGGLGCAMGFGIGLYEEDPSLEKLINSWALKAAPLWETSRAYGKPVSAPPPPHPTWAPHAPSSATPTRPPSHPCPRPHTLRHETGSRPLTFAWLDLS